jgi:hypothetical protein
LELGTETGERKVETTATRFALHHPSPSRIGVLVIRDRSTTGGTDVTVEIDRTIGDKVVCHVLGIADHAIEKCTIENLRRLADCIQQTADAIEGGAGGLRGQE